MQIYVACLASYNNGVLHGDWIDVTDLNITDVDILEESIQKILETSPVEDAEEWAVHDYNEFGSIGDILGEYPKLENILKAVYIVNELGLSVAEKLVEHYGDIDEALSNVENFVGVYDSVGDYAYELLSHEVPDWLRSYVNWESIAEDWEINGEILSIERRYQTVYVFAVT